MGTFNLKGLREDTHLTQKQLSELLDVPQSFISNVERGKDPMPFGWKKKIEEQLSAIDISKYETGDSEVSNYQIYSSFNDVNKVVDLIKSHDDLFRNLLLEKDRQISRLLSIIENGRTADAN